MASGEPIVFLKRCRRRKNGKSHDYWALVESYRTPRGSRHRVVAYLGELSSSEQKGWGRLATLLDRRAAASAQQLSLFEPPAAPDEEPVPDEITVNLEKLHVERTRDFGDVYLGLTLWKMLELDTREQEAHRRLWDARKKLILSVQKARSDLAFEIDRIVGTAGNGPEDAAE